MTRILGLSGSLRAASTNTALLRALQHAMPDGSQLEVHDYSAVPHYNADIEDLPPSVAELKAAIETADGVLIATPEYNYSVPGVLKNAIDWASRPAYRSPFRNTPTGVVSAAASIAGGARAQQHLKTILLGMGTPVFAWPELLVYRSFQKIEDGELRDEQSLKAVRQYAEGYVDWVQRWR